MRKPTVIAVVIYQYDLFEQVVGGSVHGRTDGAQNDWERLIHKDEDYTNLREVGWVRHVFAPAGTDETQMLICEGISKNREQIGVLLVFKTQIPFKMY